MSRAGASDAHRPEGSERVGADAASRFAALMQRLARDAGDTGTSGAALYEKLRARLIQFFRLHLPAEAEALADVALDRLARRLQDGVPVESLSAYTLGIARLVLHEARARQARQWRAIELEAGALEPAPVSAAVSTLETADDDIEPWLAALDACLGQLGRRSGGLILEYYGGEGAQRIRARQQLAQRLGISLNALRNRALRLRAALEDCVHRRVAADRPSARDGMEPAHTDQ